MFMRLRTYVHKLTKQASWAREHMFRKEAGSEQQGSKQALGLLMEQLRSNLGAGKSMARAWLRYALLVLMMVVGSTRVWADDYSGTYYLANNNLKNNQYDYKGYDNSDNFYLCPAQEYYYGTTTYQPANEKPFLTTNKTRQTDESLWIVEKVTEEGYTNYYTIKQKVGDKFWFITVNDKITGINKEHRRRVHLEKLESNELTDRNYFTIELITTIDGMRGYTIGCVDSYKNGDNKYLNPAGGNYAQYTANGNDHGGIVGFYKKGAIGTDASGSIWFFEVPKPIINIDEHFKLTFTCANTDVTIHYTIDGGDPSAPGTGDVYDASDDIQLTEGVHTIKAIAVMNSGNTDYASGVATYIVRILNTTSSYLIQNLECTDFYMMPGDVDKGNTTVNTSSLFRSTMEWTFSYAGSENGFLYYYIINGSTGDYLYTNTNNGAVYMKTNTVFNDAEDKTDYMFSIEQGYSDAEKNNPDGFHIVPKAKISDNTYCIYKGGWGNSTPPVLANSKADAIKGSNNARRPEQYHTRWNIITYAAPGNVLPTSLVTSDESNPTLFKIENLGTPGQYMNDASPVGTATTGSNELAWYIKEVASNSERKYYYIVNKNGNYLKFNQTIPATPSSMGGKSNVLSLLDYNSSESDRYQFVFAKSTIDGAYYIVPKGLEDATYSQYYALYLDANNTNQPIKSTKNRQSDSYKWKLVPFCYNPIFVESNGNITLSCATTGAEIHYTNDGTEPDGSSTTYSSGWASSTQLGIKAIAVIKDGSDNVVSTSEVVTLLNRPDVTLESGPFVYKGAEWKPEVNSVSVGKTEAPKSPATYTRTYSNNTNAGTNTASVDIADAYADDNWYIWNVPTTYFTITKATLTVTAENKTVEYGSPAPTYYPISYNGWAQGEFELEGIDTKPTATCTTYTTTSAVGSLHDIVPSGGADNNYDFTYVNGTLTVAAAFVTLTANSRTVTYDGTEQTVTGFTCSVDGLSFTNAGVSASGSGTGVGTYDVTFSGVTLNSTKDNTNQYIVTNIVDGTLTIDPAEATVTADDKSKTYGEADPAFTATVTGMVNSESTDLISYTLNRATGNNVGDYVITPTGDAAQGNYTVSYVPGTFTINQKALTITANNHVITYGIPPENNGVTYSGFIEGENENTEGVFTGTLAYKYNSANDESGDYYTTTIPKGTYYIIPSGLTATNYAITYAYGTLTVNAKSIGDGSIATDFTLEFGDGGSIILMDGETELQQGESGGDEKDFIISSTTLSESGRYSQRTISGKGNYTGYFAIRNANVNFQTDDDRVEWSATFVAEKSGETDIGHALPEGVRAYIITDIIGEWAIPEPLDYIPEGIPVLLISNKESGGFLVENANPDDVTPITREGSGNQKDANMLKEVTASTPGYISDSGDLNYEKVYFDLRTIYLLSYNEFVHNMPGYLAKGKVYLDPTRPTPPPSPAPSRLRIKWETDMGIEDTHLSLLTSPDAWYTLDGRRLSSRPVKRGLYINEGKKVIIR